MDQEIRISKKRKLPKVLLVTLLVAGIISLVTTLSVLLKDDGNFFLLHVFTNILLTKRIPAHFSLFVVCRRRHCRCKLFSFSSPSPESMGKFHQTWHKSSLGLFKLRARFSLKGRQLKIIENLLVFL